MLWNTLEYRAGIGKRSQTTLDPFEFHDQVSQTVKK